MRLRKNIFLMKLPTSKLFRQRAGKLFLHQDALWEKKFKENKMSHNFDDPRYNGDTSSFDHNNPVEIRNIPGTDISLRVLGYVMIDGHWSPVIYGPDNDKFVAYTQAQYKCHYCCDS